jgi:hypothetical protein
MIRNSRGDSVLLITQHDHALLAGKLAERLGNRQFDGPDPRPQTLLGVSLHDCGWPLHDDEPTLNRDGHPLHVLETPPEIATRVWRESARRASERDPYAGLLVSLHVFHLSAMLVKRELTPGERFDRREEMFLLNQFQQDEIERQEHLRQAVGLPVDRPLTLGLVDPGIDREEDRLRFNFAWLRAMDAISLDACTGKRVFDRAPGVHPRIGAQPVELKLGHPAQDVVTVDPWPFAGSSPIELETPARVVLSTQFADVEAFRSVYKEARVVTHKLTIRP